MTPQEVRDLLYEMDRMVKILQQNIEMLYRDNQERLVKKTS